MSTSASLRARYEGAVLIDGTGTEPVTDAVLVVGDDGRIVYAGAASQAPDGGDVPVLDLGGRTLLPGFIDCHVHFALGGEMRGTAEDLLMTSPSCRAFKIARRMRDTLHAGVTTARDLGGIDAGYRAAQENGLLEGPRLQVAHRMLGPTGGHSDFTLPGVVSPDLGLGRIVDTPEEALRESRALLRDGADWLKVCATGGMSSPSDDPGDVGLDEEMIRAVLRPAVTNRRCHGVAAHAQGTAGVLNALRAGVTSIEHGYGLDDEGRELMLSRGAVLVPTLSAALRLPERGTVPEYLWQKKHRWAERSRENLAAAIAAGAPVVLGTDSGIGPHARNLTELAHLTELGLTPLQAITAGTRDAARLLGLDDRIGTLQAGRLADFTVAGTDPLSDIGSLARPETIVLVAQAGQLRKNSLGPSLARR